MLVWCTLPRPYLHYYRIVAATTGSTDHAPLTLVTPAPPTLPAPLLQGAAAWLQQQALASAPQPLAPYLGDPAAADHGGGGSGEGGGDEGVHRDAGALPAAGSQGEGCRQAQR